MERDSIPNDYLEQWLMCEESPAYFIDTYCQILDSVSMQWIPFTLWDEQIEVVEGWHTHQYNIALKARQLGLTWLALGYSLWQIVFHKNAEVMLVSRRQDEAWYMAGEERLRGMYKQLPAWMQARGVRTDNTSHWRLSNGSGARAFPSNNVDSYSANLMIMDEADNPGFNFQSLLVSAKPTIDAGGKLIIISRSYKEKPNSYFKKLFRAAWEGKNQYNAVFLPWHVHPRRTRAWYEEECRAAMETDGSLDTVKEQYPETVEEALEPRSHDKRIPAEWVNHCFVQATPIPADMWSEEAPDLASVDGVEIYELPAEGETYRAGADPAEGNPNSDDSALIVVNRRTGEQVAKLVGKHEPGTFARYMSWLLAWYNDAPVMIERNNHGHAVILAADLLGVGILSGEDQRHGWLNTTYGKVRLYDELAQTFQQRNCMVHSFGTMTQIKSIENNTLRAPQGEHDDEADAFALAQVARAYELEETWLIVTDYEHDT